MFYCFKSSLKRAKTCYDIGGKIIITLLINLTLRDGQTKDAPP